MSEFDTAHTPLSAEEIAAARQAIDPILLPLLNEIRGTANHVVSSRGEDVTTGHRVGVTRLDFQRKTKGTHA